MDKDTDLIKRIEKAIENNDRDSLDDAFNIIYGKYNKLVKFISYRIVRRIEVAEDICQDAFLNFFNALNKTKIRNIKFYLTTSARNLSLNYLNSIPKGLIKDDEWLDTFIDEDLNSDLKEKLSEFRSVLKDEELEIVIFRLVYNFTFREIAIDKGVSVNVISSNYRRAIKKLKKIYK